MPRLTVAPSLTRGSSCARNHGDPAQPQRSPRGDDRGPGPGVVGPSRVQLLCMPRRDRGASHAELPGGAGVIRGAVGLPTERLVAHVTMRRPGRQVLTKAFRSCPGYK
jgi:hypothetical protein